MLDKSKKLRVIDYLIAKMDEADVDAVREAKKKRSELLSAKKEETPKEE